jgi:hypothetical protein
MDHGRLRAQGPTSEVIESYIEENDRIHIADVRKGGAMDGLRPVYIDRVEILNSNGRAESEFAWGEPVSVRLHYVCRAAVEAPYFFITLSRPGPENPAFLSCSMFDDSVRWPLQPGEGAVECRLDPMKLAPGAYELRCSILRAPSDLVGQKFYQDFFVGGRFMVRGTPAEVGRPGLLPSMVGTMSPVMAGHTWSLQNGAERRNVSVV